MPVVHNTDLWLSFLEVCLCECDFLPVFIVALFKMIGDCLISEPWSWARSCSYLMCWGRPATSDCMSFPSRPSFLSLSPIWASLPSELILISPLLTSHTLYYLKPSHGSNHSHWCFLSACTALMCTHGQKSKNCFNTFDSNAFKKTHEIWQSWTLVHHR